MTYWIAVTDHLPDIGQRCVATNGKMIRLDSRSGPPLLTGEFMGSPITMGKGKEKPTHWLPIPDLPNL